MTPEDERIVERLRAAARKVSPKRLRKYLSDLERDAGRTGPGRRPLRDGVARTDYIGVRISTEELEALKANAAAAGLGVSPFVIWILQEAGALKSPKGRRA